MSWDTGGVRVRREAWQAHKKKPWGTHIDPHSIWKMLEHDYGFQWTLWDWIFLWPITIEYGLWIVLPNNPIRREHFWYDQPSMPLGATSAPHVVADQVLPQPLADKPAGLSPQTHGYTTALLDLQRGRSRDPKFRQAGSRALGLWRQGDALSYTPT